jgi:predicted O-methyltransferase YrrM
VSDPTWNRVDEYIAETLIGRDPVLDQALADADAAGMPAIAVSPAQGKLLFVLAKSMGARRILEIGTLAGYSGIWLARALPDEGRLVTLEVDPTHARVAQRNFARADVAERVDLRLGRARDTLESMIAAGESPFDLIFIDADKTGYPTYFRAALALSRPGTLMIADNVVRNGHVADPTSTDENVRAVQAFTALVASEPRVSATIVQTVGVKGYDGFLAITVT